ncbi:hypothetical protein [Paenibacillus sp. N3.4]|uniref:hypothetical protein n=1 Tax=Paenibacillus sp. N3.4 TaxID=2603222 RepID=UPI0011CA6187|nr:hypothetical protein [Paenibacillus sp. N3.4]TXK86107.1 hypothetical protein FU659_01335 [Paenibacillus sp. N3.4]
MNKIKQAAIVRFTERNDVRCADIEVEVEGREGTLLVEFKASEGYDFDMTHVYMKDASNEIDWYDNNLHEAFQDVTEQLFQSESHERKQLDRETFKEDILSYGSIGEELEANFKLIHPAAGISRTSEIDQWT